MATATFYLPITDVQELGALVTTELSETCEIVDYDPADFTFAEKTLNKSCGLVEINPMALP